MWFAELQSQPLYPFYAFKGIKMNSKSIYISPNYTDYIFKTERIWRTDDEYEPFVYIIQEVETEMLYIGSRIRYSRPSCLESDLGTIYFTSSKEFDWESDSSSFEICRIIPCASNHDALILEGKLIEQNGAVYDENYYNIHHPMVGFNTSGYTFSEETKRKMSDLKKGKPLSKEHSQKIIDSNRGKTHSEETKKKISESCKGKIRSEETKRKMSESSKNRPKKKCPNCKKNVFPNVFALYHGDKCKNIS